MDLPTWAELRAAFVPAFLGALMAVAALLLLRLVSRLRRHGALRDEARRMEEGLRSLSIEVEARLDSKLDRLESLLRDARSLTAPTLRRVDPVAEVPPEARTRWDSLGSVSSADRNRVLQLAELGKLPDAIADAVGLLRGEVDLILRLHRGPGKLEGR
jgi:hypothetical protein